jgi:hypothetical protein
MVVFLFNTLIYVFLLSMSMYSYCCLCILIVRPCILIVVYVFLLFVHVFLSLSMYTYCYLCFLRRGYPDWGFSVHDPHSSKFVVLFYVLFVSYRSNVLFVCKCVLYYCHGVTTQLQLTNISYHINKSFIICF